MREPNGVHIGDPVLTHLSSVYLVVSNLVTLQGALDSEEYGANTGILLRGEVQVRRQRMSDLQPDSCRVSYGSQDLAGPESEVPDHT